MTKIVEIWKDIKEFEGIYQVSNLGNVKSLNFNKTGQEKLLSIKAGNNGYCQLNLCRDGGRYRLSVHRLVSQAFIGDCPDGYEVNHKNGIKHDNRAENLEYCTRSENQNHAIKNKLKIVLKGSEVGDSKLTERDVLNIRELSKTKGYPYISERYGIAKSAVCLIVNRKRWNHI